MAIQVYEATKDGQGNPLSVLSRQFVSFSYGGKNIEDFNLLAVFVNDRLTKDIYAPFEDTTTDQAELDGQLFWRSHYQANTLSFSLATDGITQQELEDFKSWFIPGIERELILTENSNRAIMARVSATPQINMIPFEEKVEVNVAGTKYLTSTSLYKGEIILNFVMDDPFWYSIAAIVNDLSQEKLKVIHEDGVPHISMLKEECLLADNLYYSEGSITTNSGLPIDPDDQTTDRYLYYCGTAKERPILSFKVEPQFEEETGVASFGGASSLYYIKVGRTSFQFSLPPILSSYNEALKIVSEFNGTSILDLRKELRDELGDYYARSHAIKIIDSAINDASYVINGSEILSSFYPYFIDEMKKLFPEGAQLFFIFNSKTGEATVEILNQDIVENCGNMVKSVYLTLEERTLPLNGLISGAQMLKVLSNFSLTDLKIEYKYRYL